MVGDQDLMQLDFHKDEQIHNITSRYDIGSAHMVTDDQCALAEQSLLLRGIIRPVELYRKEVENWLQENIYKDDKNVTLTYFCTQSTHCSNLSQNNSLNHFCTDK